MTSSELRIGNCLKHKNYPDMAFHVVGLNGTLVQIESGQIHGYFEHHRVECDVEPIELTKEWLVKLGFTSNDVGVCMIKGWDYMGWKELELMKTNNGYWAILSNHASGEETARVNLRVVEFVHELQNLYYMLSNDELQTS